MMKLVAFVILALIAGPASAAPTLFQELQEEFRKSSLPSQKEALGYWAGHCVHSHDTETRWPAVYVSKTILDSNSNIEKPSQTYFWEKRNDADFFMAFSAQQLNQYVPFMTWIQKEQWTPTTILDQSLTNSFELSSGTIIRSVRVTETEFTRNYLLQVSRRTTKGTEVISYCSFSKELEVQTPGENTPTFLVHTGPVGNTFAEIRLPFQKRPMRSLVIQKKSTELIGLSRIEVLLDNGQVMYFSPSAFEKSDSIAFRNEYGTPFRAVAIRFYISGFASDLQIYGMVK